MYIAAIAKTSLSCEFLSYKLCEPNNMYYN
jgi:hypothetical protein